MENLWIIAQAGQTQAESGQSEISAEPAGQQQQTMTTAADGNTPGSATPARPLTQTYSWIFLIVIFVVMFFMFREPRRRQKQQQKMVSSLKKNDKVRTIGGIIGTIVDIRGDEIVLKVDEGNNTKIHVLASAIGKTLETEKQ